MNLLLLRNPSSAICTLGTLYMNDAVFCYTLEDVERTQKIKGITAIPRGEYEVIINWSGRFNKPMPLLLDVPGFAGVRIHWGNTAQDTEGCILVGYVLGNDAIYKSKDAYNDLFELIKQAITVSEKIMIRVDGKV